MYPSARRRSSSVAGYQSERRNQRHRARYSSTSEFTAATASVPVSMVSGPSRTGSLQVAGLEHDGARAVLPGVDAWQHQVNVRGERVREPVEGERGLVRDDDSGALRPEPELAFSVEGVTSSPPSSAADAASTQDQTSQQGMSTTQRSASVASLRMASPSTAPATT